jgi:NAD/NADP transhydrogenase alpha subunit
MYAHNAATFLAHLLDDYGQLGIDEEDEIAIGTLVTRDGRVVHPRVLETLAPDDSD